MKLAKWVYVLFMASTIFYLPTFIGWALALVGRQTHKGDVRPHFQRQLSLSWWWFKWTMLLSIVGFIGMFSNSPLLLFVPTIPSFMMIPKAWAGLQLLNTEETGATADSETVVLDTVDLTQTRSSKTASLTSSAVAASSGGVAAMQSQAAAVRTDALAQFEKHMPLVREKLAEVLGKAGQSIQQYGVERAFGAVHKQLPFPVRIVLPKKRFIEFCVAHQHQLVPAAG